MHSAYILRRAFPQSVHHFHTGKSSQTSCDTKDKRYDSTQRKSDLPEEESRQGPSREPATRTTAGFGRLDADGQPEEALTADVMVKRRGKRAHARRSRLVPA